MTWTEILNLVEKARAGDRAAYGELVKRFEPAVYAVALSRLRNPTEAQELTQEVFIHGMEKVEQLRDARCFARWLRQITMRMAINRMTRREPMQGYLGRVEALPDPTDHQGGIEAMELRLKVREAVDR